ncbi:MAG: aldehyde ferredoxin oxidoreductase [Anaerolineaceae bacterium]|nr:aldehyde ferredoxin oxidoreductase [Anaerolineaceae bacterium]
MNMTGRFFRINLTTREITKETISEEMIRRYLLGSGYAAYLYHQEMDPMIGALDPNNALYVFNGLLSGYTAPTGCRSSWCGRSPLSGIWNEANMGGHFGGELRKTGWDGFVATGRAEKPVYLYIQDDQIEVRSAEHLWGKDTFETYDQLINETDPKARAAVIGPAGENQVLFAAVVQGGSTHSRAAGRGGMGAVMGSKNLKGVVVRGTSKPDVFDTSGFRSYVKETNKTIQAASKGLSAYGTAGGVEGAEAVGDLPIRNWAAGSWEDGATAIAGQTMQEKYPVKQAFCFACPIGCGKQVTTENEDGTLFKREAPEYETLAGFGGLLEIDDIDTVIAANDYCNRMGLDTMSTSTVAAFAYEAYQNGLISTEAVGGYDLTWGNKEALPPLLDRITYRSGAGAYLADGVRLAAEFLGHDSEKYAIHVKGLELANHDPRAINSMAVGYATANRGGCHLETLSYWTIYGLKPPWSTVEIKNRFEPENAAQQAVDFQNYFSAYNPLGLCKFISKSRLSAEDIAEYVALLTGWEFSGEEYTLIGERLFNLKRLINQKLGVNRKDDTLPPRILTEARPDGMSAGKLPDLPLLLNTYYEIRGWDSEGVPLQETLSRLSLEL